MERRKEQRQRVKRGWNGCMSNETRKGEKVMKRRGGEKAKRKREMEKGDEGGKICEDRGEEERCE